MMTMVQAINGDHISQLTNRGERELEVACVTCHAGRAQPATLDQETLKWEGDAHVWIRKESLIGFKCISSHSIGIWTVGCYAQHRHGVCRRGEIEGKAQHHPRDDS